MYPWTNFLQCSSGGTLLQHQVTVVGTMRKCKREIQECMTTAKSRQTKTSVLGFNNEMTMVSYVPKKNKAVILLITMHHRISIVEEDPKKEVRNYQVL